MLASLGARAVEGVQERTVAGALVTFGAVVSIVLLLFLECSSFFAPLTIHHVGVDDGDTSGVSKPPFDDRSDVAGEPPWPLVGAWSTSGAAAPHSLLAFIRLRSITFRTSTLKTQRMWIASKNCETRGTSEKSHGAA